MLLSANDIIKIIKGKMKMVYLKKFGVLVLVIFLANCAGTESESDLKNSDFALVFNDETIALDAPFESFSTASKVMDVSDHDLGEVEVGAYRFHSYNYAYDDFEIYVSNALYDQKQRDEESLYISQIDAKTDKVKTPRGITIGSSLDDITEAYGHGSILEEEDHEEIFFDYYEKNLTFILKDSKVTGMYMVIDFNASEIAKEDE